MDQKHGSTCLPPFKETKAKFQGNFETSKVIDADHRSSSNRNINNSSILNFLSHIFLPFLLPKQEELNLSNNFREKNIFHPRVAKLKSHEYDTIYICLGLQCSRTIFIYFFSSRPSLSPWSDKGIRCGAAGNCEDTVRARGKSTGSNVYVEVQ